MTKLILFLVAVPLFGQLGANVSLAPCTMTYPVDASTGTTAGYYAKFNTGGVGVTLGATTDTKDAFVGVADQTVGAGGGKVLLHTCGPIKVEFDGATTAGNAFTISPTTNGAMVDMGVGFGSGCSTGGGALGEISQTIGGTGMATAVIKPCVGSVYGIPLIWANTSAALNATDYIGCGGNSSSTESQVQCVIPVTGVIDQIYVQLSASTGSGNENTFTLMQCTPTSGACSGGASTLTCNINNAISCNDTSHTLAVTAGDLIDLKSIVALGSPTSKTVTWSLHVLNSR